VETTPTTSGLREAVILRGPASAKPWERMVAFAQGFVAGFGGGVQPPTRAQALQRTLTRADCPAARRKSEPPAARPSTPPLPGQPAPRSGVVSIPLPRRPTLTGLAPPTVGRPATISCPIQPYERRD
jgi:hypothetical protein